MTQPRPLGNNARAYVTDAERAAKEIRRIRERAASMAPVDRKGLEAALWQIEAQAVLIELACTRAKNGNGETE